MRSRRSGGGWDDKGGVTVDPLEARSGVLSRERGGIIWVLWGYQMILSRRGEVGGGRSRVWLGVREGVEGGLIGGSWREEEVVIRILMCEHNSNVELLQVKLLKDQKCYRFLLFTECKLHKCYNSA